VFRSTVDVIYPGCGYGTGLSPYTHVGLLFHFLLKNAGTVSQSEPSSLQLHGNSCTVRSLYFAFFIEWGFEEGNSKVLVDVSVAKVKKGCELTYLI